MPSISVVITTFNRAALLQATLRQLQRQRYEESDEVIVVDNASTDSTSDVIARATADFPVPLHQMRELVRGKSPALNRGIAAARGDVLALTDDDVLVADDWIATIRALFEDPDLALVGGRVDPRWERQAPRWLRFGPQGRYGNMASPLALLHYGSAQPLGDRTAVGANLVLRRSVAQALGGFAAHLGRRSGTLLCGEDHDFCSRAVAAGYRCEYRPEVRVQHWVPAQRTRLRYYLRWFFWSGVTNAVLERSGPAGRAAGSVTPPVARYLWRVLATAPVRVLVALAAGRGPEAAERAMDAAFALGYSTQRYRDRRSERLVRWAPESLKETPATPGGRISAPAVASDRNLSAR